MTTATPRVTVGTASPALARARKSASAELSEASLRRRVAWIWGLLFLNVLPYDSHGLIPLPTSGGKVISQGALAVALLLVVSLNRRILTRPNLFLVLMTILCVTSIMMSVRGYYGVGSVLRAVRLTAFVGVLWMLTPWWGRNDLLLLRCHRRVLSVIVAVVLLGLVIAPGFALGQAGGGRLGGTLWPMQPTEVAHYAAILAGSTLVLWFAGLVRGRGAAVAIIAGLAVLLLTHTRTALVALVVAVGVAGLSLLLTRRRVRRAFSITILVAALVAASVAPFVVTWFLRGESHKGFTNLTGRRAVWTALVAQPRPAMNFLFGYGMSNDSYHGLSIDSGWLSIYQDQGVAGDALVGAQFVLLLLLAAFSRGPRRAIALFFVVYVLVTSIAETGIGQASPYLLDLTIAASVLMAPVTGEPDRVSYPELPRAGDLTGVS